MREAMDQIFAPWRMDWVTRSDSNSEFDECVFCELPQRGNDVEYRVLARSDLSYSVLNNAPYNPGHTLVIPFAHSENLIDLSMETLVDTMFMVRKTVNVIDEAFKPDGFNIGLNIKAAAGASIEDHLHVHVIPRWQSDTTFLPTASNTKLIVESLDASYERLRDSYKSLDDVEIPDKDTAVRLTGTPFLTNSNNSD